MFPMMTKQDGPAKRYIIQTADYQEAIATDQLDPQHVLCEAGPLWIVLWMTPAQRALYVLPCWEEGTCIIARNDKNQGIVI